MIHSRIHITAHVLSLLVAGAITAGCATFEPVAEPQIEDYAPPPIEYTEADTAEPDDPPTAIKGLTVDTCVEIALANNPQQAAAEAGLMAASEAVGEARAPYYPQVTLDGGYQRWERHAFLPDELSEGMTSFGENLGLTPESPSTIGPTDEWSLGVAAQFTLFDSGERRAQHRAALARRDMAAEERRSVHLDVAFDVERAYYALASAIENREAAAAALERSEGHLRIAEARRDAGAAPQADVVRAQSEAAESRLRLIETESAIRIACGNLNIVMGLSPETPIEQELTPESISRPKSAEIVEQMDNALHARPELAAALKQVQAGRHSEAAARGAFGPRISGQARYGWRDEDFTPRDRDWTVGVTFEAPLFTGYAATHRVSRKEAETQQYEAEVRQLALAVRNEVWNAYAELDRTYETVQASKAFVEEAQEGLRLVRARYEVDAATISDLLDAQTALIRAEADHVNSQWEYFQARAAFYRATGEYAPHE